MNIFVRMGLRVNKRIVVTIIGIAFCVTYLAGVVSLVEGLEEGSERVSGMFEEDLVLVYSNSTMSESRIDPSLLDELSGNYSCFVLCQAIIGGEDVTLAGVRDPEGHLGMDIDFCGNEIVPGRSALLDLEPGDLTITCGSESVQSNFSRRFYTPLLSEDWVYASPELVWSMRPEMAGIYSFVVLEPRGDDVTKAESSDCTVMGAVSMMGFFEGGIAQIQVTLWAIVMSSAVIIVLLSYSLIGIEVKFRGPDIAILRYVGAPRSMVVGIFIVQALFISALGGLVGVACGFIAANALTSLAPIMGYLSFVAPQASVSSLGYPWLISIIAGIAGGVVPAYNASRSVTPRGER